MIDHVWTAARSPTLSSALIPGILLPWHRDVKPSIPELQTSCECVFHLQPTRAVRLASSACRYPRCWYCRSTLLVLRPSVSGPVVRTAARRVLPIPNGGGIDGELQSHNSVGIRGPQLRRDRGLGGVFTPGHLDGEEDHRREELDRRDDRGDERRAVGGTVPRQAPQRIGSLHPA